MQHGIYHHEGSRPDEVDLRIRPDIRLPNVFQKDEKKDEKKAEGIHMNTGCMLECLSLQHAQVIEKMLSIEMHFLYSLGVLKTYMT